jgi:predicted Zn-dependent protease with MMP-like domain
MQRLSMSRFRRIVQRVVETLPSEIRQHLHNVVVDVEEEPSLELLEDMGFSPEEIDDGCSLFGLFVPMESPGGWGGDETLDQPRRILIFKQPLEECFTDRRQLLIEIRKTVIHEIAHHFGYSDRDLERFDDTPDPFGDDPELFA